MRYTQRQLKAVRRKKENQAKVPQFNGMSDALRVLIDNENLFAQVRLNNKTAGVGTNGDLSCYSVRHH